MVARCDDHATCRVVRHELSAYPSLKSSQITNKPDATIAVIPAGDDGHGNDTRCWRWCGGSRGRRCRTLTHFRCKGNMVDRVPQIEEDASPAVGKSAMMVFAADRAAAGVTVHIPAEINGLRCNVLRQSRGVTLLWLRPR